MSLSQTKRDLGRFAQDKLYHYMKDVVQSFEIAGLSGGEALACMGALFMRIASTMAAEKNMPDEKWMEMCTYIFERAKEMKEEDDNDDDED